MSTRPMPLITITSYLLTPIRIITKYRVWVTSIRPKDRWYRGFMNKRDAELLQSVSTDDLIYSPIFPDEELKRLVRRILSNPGDGAVIEEVSSDIVDLFRGVGITDQETIIDTVHRKLKEISELLATTSQPGNLAPPYYEGGRFHQTVEQHHKPVIILIQSPCQSPWS